MTGNGLDQKAFRAALARGHGRALQATRATGQLIDRDSMLDACLHDRTYDPQAEPGRAPWLMEILEAADALDDFRAPILDALKSSTEIWDLDQLCDLAVFFAEHGEEQARTTLYELWDRRPHASADWLAEEQIIRLDGLNGFLYMAERLGALSKMGEGDPGAEDLVSVAADICGSEQVAAALESAASRSHDMRAFNARLRDERGQSQAGPLKQTDISERMRGVSGERIIEIIEDTSYSHANVKFRRWGEYAEGDSLRQLASRMFSENDPLKLAKYLRVFSSRPLPDFDDRLTELTSHSDSTVRWLAFRAAAANKHPAVRALALRRLQSGKRDGDTIALLARNLEPGDKHLVESVLTPCEDPDQMHDMCWGLLHVFDENETAECAQSMRFTYEYTPCSNCRRRAVAKLLKFEQAPSEVIEECRFDANPKIRDMVTA